MRAKLLIVVLVASIGATGCIRNRYLIESRKPAQIQPDPFSYTAASRMKVTNEPDESGEYLTSTLTYPAQDREDPLNETVRAKLRVPKRVSRGLVIVLPILGGDYGPSEAFATFLSSRGFATLRFDRKKLIFDPDGDFVTVARRIRQGVIDIRRGIDLVTDMGLTDRGIGVLGLSMGSFAGTMLAATDRRITAAVLALGGTGIVELVLDSASDEEEIAEFLGGLRKRGYDRDRIDREAHASLDALDTIGFAPYLDNRSTYLIHARFDAVVPYDFGTQLWEAAGKPKRLTLLTGHYTAVFALPVILSETEQHFGEHLAKKRP